MSSAAVEFKHVDASYQVDSAKRIVTGYASVFGNLDRDGDVVMPGAFTATLAEDLPLGLIEVRRNHKYRIGEPLHAEQDTHGLLTVSEIERTPLGDAALRDVRDGVITFMSIGFNAPIISFKSVDGRRVRELEAVRLIEWSLLDIRPSNPLAIVTSGKEHASAPPDNEALAELLTTMRRIIRVA